MNELNIYFIFILLLLILLFCILPVKAQEKSLSTLEEELNNHVKMLAQTIGERHPIYYEKLEKTASYIESVLKQTGLEFSHHTYIVEGKEYTNLVFQKQGEDKEKPIILIGAHYDSAPGTPGADDNASAVAALLVIAKSLASYKNNHMLRFVFFTLEEPPYFKTDNMGSSQYAKYMKDKNEKLKLMICLEMLGFYSDKKIQEYPNPELEKLYPVEANFIGVVSNIQYANITTKFYQSLKKHNEFSTQLLIAPPSITGVDFSDHQSYWEYEYPALMITDTSFYRNKNYHGAGDLPDTLDYKKMTILTNALIKAVQELDE